MYKKIFDVIDRINDEYIKIWEDVCNIESPSNYKEGVDAVGSYFIKMAEKRGFEIEICRQNVSGDVVRITMNPNAKGRPVSFSGHIDTVHPVGTFGSPAVRIEGDKIYGPGVEDCKGGTIAGFMAMDALLKLGFKDRPIHLLLQSDEEVGSNPSKKATINFICDKAKDSIAFFNLEGHSKGKACLIRKGIVTFTFTVKGEEAHSANCATKGANAILEAAYKIIDLEKIKDEEGLTCCCSVINGGTVANTVPALCTFKANVRFATQEQLEWIRNYVEEVAKNNRVPGCSCTVTQPGGRISMEYSERNVDLLRRMNEVFEACGIPVLVASKSKGGSDAADVTAAGIPCVDSIGVRGGAIHSPNEFAYIESLSEAAKRLAVLAYYL